MLFLNRESGQGLAEYALLITFIALALVLILAVFGQELQVLFGHIACEVFKAVNDVAACS